MSDQYYEKVEGDESSDSLMSSGTSSRVMRAPPTQTKKRSMLAKLAIGSLATVVFLGAVSVASSWVVAYKLPAATEAALAQSKTSAAAATVTVTELAPTATLGVPKLTDSNKDVTNNESSIFSFPNHHQEMRTCGGTPDEARAAGCVFDVMMQLWTPPECMDKPLSERFLATGNWTWYATPDASKIYDDEEIRKGNHDVVYVDQSYHRHHCIFAWERLVRAMRNQAPLIEELISYDHVMHCRHKTLTLPSEGAESVRGVVAPTGYTKCASYDVWIHNLPFNKMSSID